MGLWAVSVYYNPQRYASRYRNFARFRNDLEVPLLVVEWVPDGGFELRGPDADILVQLSGGDLMWQKERLLNLAIESLPPDCEIVAWLDHDILFQDRCWAAELESVMARAPIAQLFTKVTHLPPEGVQPPLFLRESIVSVSNNCTPDRLGELIKTVDPETTEKFDSGDELREQARIAARPSSGHAWAARRVLLEEFGLYDACICGAGDMAVALAALGLPELFTSAFPLNAAQQKHYLAWARPFAAAVGGNVGVLPTGVDHLFHGLISNRQYRSRMHWACTTGFDPVRDLTRDVHGPWRWSRKDIDREAWMNSYFQQRLEDDLSLMAESSGRVG